MSYNKKQAQKYNLILNLELKNGPKRFKKKKHVYSGPKDQHLFVKFQRGASTIVYEATPFFSSTPTKFPKNAFGILYNYSSPQATPTSFITQRIHGTGRYIYLHELTFMDFMKVKIPFVPWILWVRVFSTEVIDVDWLREVNRLNHQLVKDPRLLTRLFLLSSSYARWDSYCIWVILMILPLSLTISGSAILTCYPDSETFLGAGIPDIDPTELPIKSHERKNDGSGRTPKFRPSQTCLLDEIWCTACVVLVLAKVSKKRPPNNTSGHPGEVLKSYKYMPWEIRHRTFRLRGQKSNKKTWSRTNHCRFQQRLINLKTNSPILYLWWRLGIHVNITIYINTGNLADPFYPQDDGRDFADQSNSW